MSTVALMETLLRDAFAPQRLDIRDDSHLHAGHTGVKERGGGHYHLTLISDRFEGLRPVARHRLVYQCLAPIQSQIHALSMHILTPAEAP